MWPKALSKGSVNYPKGLGLDGLDLMGWVRPNGLGLSK